MDILKKKIVIFSHYATTGACEELRDWLIRNKADQFVYAAFPFGSNKNSFIQVDIYCNGALVKRDRSLFKFKFKIPESLSYIKDFVYALFYTFKYARNSDVLVCGDNLLTFAAATARPFASVRNVVYYMIDYTPVRYKNKIMNAVYQCVDRRAAYMANRVWPLTKEMIEARFDAGVMKANKVAWRVTPYGCRVFKDSAGSVESCSVVYMGEITLNKGAELFVPIMKELKKKLPSARMIVVGGGGDLSRLHEKISESGLEEAFQLHGFVESFDEVLAIVRRGTVAIAPYNTHDKNNFTFYSDPGKIKTYLGCGVPIVLTDVPPVAKILQQRGAGKIAEYCAEDFAQKIFDIFKSEIGSYSVMRDEAKKMGGECSWDLIFSEAFKNLLE